MGTKELQSVKKKSSDIMYSVSYDKWLRSYYMLRNTETDMSTSPFIYHGYRPNPSTFLYCLKSAFYPHHDLMNFWTHFLAFFVFVYKGYVTMTTLSDPFNMIYAPYWLHMFGGCYIMLASSFAHLFNCHSSYAQEACYCFDYTALSVMGGCFLVSYEHYLSPVSCCTNVITPTGYIATIFVCLVIVAALAIYSRFPNCPKRYLFRYLPSGIISLAINVPLFMKIFSMCDATTTTCNLGNERMTELVIKQGVLTFVAYIFVLSCFPEKYFPGYFDIFGHSHQIFHVFVAFVLYHQNLSIEGAMHDVRKLFEQRKLNAEALNISKFSTFGVVFATVFVGSILIIKISKTLEKIVDRKRKIH